MWFKAFLRRPSCTVVSGDKMRNKASGPGWPTTQTAQGRLPERLRGGDQEATRGRSPSGGWGSGHGAFCVGSPRPGLLGAFKSRRQSAHEAQRPWWATGPLRGVVATGVMASKAEDCALLAELQRQRGITPVPTPRTNRAHTVERRQLMHALNRPRNRRLRRQRGQTVEPMQGVVQDIFALERCGMRGHHHNRWLFAAMGAAVPLHQARALTTHRSTWKIKQAVLGW